jgi:hypothetical protein
MQQILNALKPLDYQARIRVVRWAIQRFDLPFNLRGEYVAFLNESAAASIKNIAKPNGAPAEQKP